MAGYLLWGPVCEMRSALFPGLCSLVEQLGHFTEENCVRISAGNRMHKVKQENQNEGYYGLFRHLNRGQK
ncbi:hypothetical protein LXL04_023413 [Taraxacum kok-saghyz]